MARLMPSETAPILKFDGLMRKFGFSDGKGVSAVRPAMGAGTMTARRT